MKKDTIAFVSTYSHPSRDSMERAVREAFPEYRLENIDLMDVIGRQRAWKVANLPWIAKEYGRQILSRRIGAHQAHYFTTFVLRRTHRYIRELIRPERHVFSFQTQSMYDTSVPGVPHFVYTDHTHLSNLHSPYFDRRMLRPAGWVALEKGIYRNATRVFTRSSDIAADLRDQYEIAPEKVKCVFAGSNVQLPATLRLDNGGYANRHILFVGGDWERKGGPDLMEAFQRVLAALPDAHLTIAGCAPAIDRPNCTILGNVPLERLTEHYAKASVFCLPTRLEPFGIAFIEAMMHRLPIVATRTGAVPDMVIDGITGRLVKTGDPAALAHALIEIAGNPQKARAYGERGYAHASENYTWERVGQRFRAEILPLITGAPGSVERSSAAPDSREPGPIATGSSGRR